VIILDPKEIAARVDAQHAADLKQRDERIASLESELAAETKARVIAEAQRDHAIATTQQPCACRARRARVAHSKLKLV
jgi:hypothetical protein